MHKILLIIQREYLTRVRKKTFLIMTILGPILMASVFVLPILISKYSQDKKYMIQIVEQNPHLFTTLLPSNEQVQFVNDTVLIDAAKKNFDPEKYYGILYVPSDIMKNPGGATLFTEKQANIQVTSYIERILREDIEKSKLKAEGINQETLESIKTNVDLKTLTLKGEKSSAALTTAVGFICGIMIYMFIFMYGVQVMRGVIEEKTNRIVEVIISSVKPFELMMGKIIGIALVGLTQFVLWIVLTSALSSVAGRMALAKQQNPQQVVKEMQQRQQATTVDQLSSEKGDQDEDINMGEIMENFDSINFPLIITCFFVYFLGGYLLYSSLFAAIGAAVDNETETQQFMLPVTIPLILSFVVAQSIVTNPESQVGFWFSMIPLTSPVVMMVRIAFGVPMWQVVLSISLLILGFVFTTWLAGRIYRTGILMYGKKVNFRELSRWLFYKS